MAKTLMQVTKAVDGEIRTIVLTRGVDNAVNVEVEVVETTFILGSPESSKVRLLSGVDLTKKQRADLKLAFDSIEYMLKVDSYS